MARPTLLKHRKFRRLVYLLGIPEAHVLGHLEYLWQGVYDSGEDAIGDRIDLELAAGWAGERGVFAEAAIAAGFFDEVDGIVTVHDLWDHAPEYVERRARKEAERRTKGQNLSEIRAEAGRRGGLSRVAKLKQNSSKTQANGDHLLAESSNLLENPSKRQAKLKQGLALPAPSSQLPAPSTKKKKDSGQMPLVESDGKAEVQQAFNAVWEAYPTENRGDYMAARSTYARTLQGSAKHGLPAVTPAEITDGLKPWVEHWRSQGTLPNYIPGLISFLNNRKFSTLPPPPLPLTQRQRDMAPELLGTPSTQAKVRAAINHAKGRPT
jgi:hypothetical protein